ncbi:MAG: glycosyltransferase, partial [Chloroflexota bacterium]
YMLPTKLFEYFAMRRPVASSGIPFIREFCSDGEVAFFPPGDSQGLADQLLRLYENPEERLALVQRADRLYEQSRWPVMREQYLNVYRSLGLARQKEAPAQEPVRTEDR